MPSPGWNVLWQPDDAGCGGTLRCPAPTLAHFARTGEEPPAPILGLSPFVEEGDRSLPPHDAGCGGTLRCPAPTLAHFARTGEEPPAPILGTVWGSSKREIGVSLHMTPGTLRCPAPTFAHFARTGEEPPRTNRVSREVPLFSSALRMLSPGECRGREAGGSSM